VSTGLPECRIVAGVETPTDPKVNPFGEIWPLEHDAEIWGHRPTDSVKQDHLEKEKVMSEKSSPESIAMKPPQPRGNPTRPPEQCYGTAEIFAALRELSMEEITQIQNFARFHLIGAERPGHVEVWDLFIDAAIRTMERKRSWKRGVTVFNHFFAVMRSIRHQRFKQAARYTPLNELVAASQNRSLSALDAQTTVALLKEQLRGDAIALDILASMMDETRPRDTQQSMGISAEVYWAARKRIRRQAENLAGAPCSHRRASAAKAATGELAHLTSASRGAPRP
jgi:hypothetical protein